MDEFFQETIEEIGEPQRPVPLGEEQARRLSGHLPGPFMTFIETYGLGDYFDRRLQYCDPDEFRSILALVFGADPDFSHRDCHVVAYSAFGRLVCWSERHDSFEVDLVDLRISSSKLAPTAFVPPPGLPRRERSTDPNILARTLLPFEKDDYEEYDNGGSRCLRAAARAMDRWSGANATASFPRRRWSASIPPNVASSPYGVCEHWGTSLSWRSSGRSI